MNELCIFQTRCRKAQADVELPANTGFFMHFLHACRRQHQKYCTYRKWGKYFTRVIQKGSWGCPAQSGSARGRSARSAIGAIQEHR